MQLEQPVHSEYAQALQYLVNSYNQFVCSLHYYASSPFLQTQKLKQLAALWQHPRGIKNLIKTLALQQSHTPEQTQTSIIQAQNMMGEAAPAPTFEVRNPLYHSHSPMIKQEECEQEDSVRESQSMSEVSKEDADESYSSANAGKSERGIYKRGPYKSYSLLEKQRAVMMLLDGEIPITDISRMLKIPCKNIKRWSAQGVYRKRGGGRKRSSPAMEDVVNKWIRENFKPGEEVDFQRVQEFALAVSGDPTFKASRGWVLKFLDRFSLRQLYLFR